MTMGTGLAPIAVTLWRDYDEMAPARPGAMIASTSVRSRPVEAARTFYADGARRAVLPDVVDLAAGEEVAVVRALVLVRELTGWGIVVDWRVRLPEDTRLWPLLSHLCPPGEVVANAGIQFKWKDTYHFFKCVFRRGPEFVQVRDYRSGQLGKITISDSRYREAIDDLLEGLPLTDVPTWIQRDLAGAGLVGVVGGPAWWLPYRVRRWPLAADII